jgi:hypothetical protein
MRRLTTVLTITVIVFGLALTGRVSQSAFAQAPSNDDISGALWLGFPDSHATSTLEATTGPGDEFGCSYGPSVWYGFTGPGTDVEVNTIGSDFDTVLTVVADYGSGLQTLSCSDDYYGFQSRVVFFAESGVTYYFLAQGYGGASGNLTINTSEPPPPPPPPTPFTFELAIDPTASVVAKSGVVTLAGTVTCSTSGYVAIYIDAKQKAGRIHIQGGGYTEAYCDETAPVAWSTQFQGTNGIFKAGTLTIQGWSDGYGFAEGSGYWSVPIDPAQIQVVGKR